MEDKEDMEKQIEDLNVKVGLRRCALPIKVEYWH